ncbi:glucosamine inositolphosphorylceramide transferase family protein [Algoriphagus taiwanensis]|uniref:Methionyl-tRNA formyltransferase n=1 Tax=Algoriphagus taiwanensis TaxID=1445656 RepID=A0ABQ6Q6A6_9BACT|nr:hypothetical protein Ataiwa_39860 [Algoriphagus taiwanensis]
MINPIQKKYRDYFLESDLKQIARLKPDILIRFGFRILSGPILNLPHLGIWSFHHGDPQIYRGGPPAFWEVIRQIPATGCVLMQLNEDLDQGKVLYQTHTQTDPLSVQRNANKLFWMSSFFPLRVLKEIDRIGADRWKERIEKKSIAPPSPLWKNPKSFELTKGLGNLFLRNLKRKLLEIKYPAHWEVGLVSTLPLSNQVISKQEINFFTNSEPSTTYFADPFPFFHQGKLMFFAELFDKKKGKGNIALLNEEGNHQVILEKPYHLSYPFLWEEDGNYYLLPESAEAGQIMVYRSTNFPFSWDKTQILFPEEAYDPTLWKTEQGYWLFVNQKCHPACSPFDELNLYFSPSLVKAKWTPHPKNPIVSDVRGARPAGRLFEKDGKLFRPAQDSERRYGHRIRVMEIKKLDLYEYLEEEAFHVEPDETSGILGIHTLNQVGDHWIMDFYSRK